MATISAEWQWFDLHVEDTPATILRKLDTSGITTKDLKHAVYIIKIFGFFAIQYEKGVSPVIYIGEGKLKQRMSSHLKWLENITELVDDATFKVGICIPKKNNGHYANQDFEAVLLHKFKELYGSAPMKNRQMEYPSADHEIKSYQTAVRAPLMIGKGVKYYWAIKPLKANEHYDSYHRA